LPLDKQQEDHHAGHPVRLLGRHLPEKVIKCGAAALFAIFGIWLIAEAVVELT
jgi:putative Ca2+/H+ antiporter (TMEM165/GDT1 family)